MLQKRAVRVTLLALLLACGVAAAVFARSADQRIQSIERDRQALATTREGLTAAVAGLSAAQQAYVTYGQRDDALFTRVSRLLEQLSSDATALRAAILSEDGAAAFVEYSAALDRLRAAEELAKDSLAADEPLTAADTLLSASREDVTVLDEKLRGVQMAESARFTSERAAVLQQSWMAIAGAAAIWTLGLIALVPVPARRPEAGAPAQVEAPPQVAPAVAPVAAPPQAPPSIDLGSAAELCTDISRLTDTSSLPDLLRRAAGILDAHGMVIWMGAGDELFAATAYGYDPAVVSRLRPIGRGADNATAAAWRTGELRTVAADGGSHGAIVAPMAGPAGPVGVIAAEVRHGRENDAATRAVTAIIASQLAAVLSAWPAASTAAGAPNAADEESAADSGRQAAAS